MFTARPGGDVDQLTGLEKVNQMPHSSGHDQCLVGTELDVAVSLLQLEEHPHAARDEVEQLITVRVHLTGVRWVASQIRRSHGVAIDPERAMPALGHEHRPSRSPLHSDHLG